VKVEKLGLKPSGPQASRFVIHYVRHFILKIPSLFFDTLTFPLVIEFESTSTLAIEPNYVVLDLVAAKKDIELSKKKGHMNLHAFSRYMSKVTSMGKFCAWG
jgi:hypothetical protein